MTGRRAPPARPTTPTDPTLQLRPPPRKHRFPIRSYGPGAAADIRERTTSTEALHHAASTSVASQTLEAVDNSDLLRIVEQGENRTMWSDGRAVESDPTWGFYIMVTDYSQTARNNLDQAMENLLRVQHRHLKVDADPPDVYANEAYCRLKFDVVLNQEALDGASDDRVRECFRAHIRGLELCADPNEFMPPSRNYACLVLDSEKIDMLVNLSFQEDDIQEFFTFRACKLKAVDIFWERPETSRSSYRGVRELGINSLSRTYLLLESERLDEVEQ
jgi:hypothetical protein